MVSGTTNDSTTTVTPSQSGQSQQQTTSGNREEVLLDIQSRIENLHGETDDMYDEHQIPKSDGSMRLLEEPQPDLKQLQNMIKDNILYRIKPHDAAYGFRRGRSLVEAGRIHSGMPLVIRVDITSFFHSFTPDLMMPYFEDYFNEDDYGPVDLRMMSEVMCKDGRLPMGAPSSPPATNIVCKRMDARMVSLVEKMEEESGTVSIAGEEEPKHDFKYTRYADDIVFSTTDEENGTDIIPQARSVVEDTGFSLNEDKTRIMRDGRRQTVLGMTVNTKTNIPLEKRDEMRSRLDNIYKDLEALENGRIDPGSRPDSHPDPEVQAPVDPETGQVINKGILQQIAGYIAYAMDVNELYGNRWKEKFDEIEEMADEQGYI